MWLTERRIYKCFQGPDWTRLLCGSQVLCCRGYGTRLDFWTAVMKGQVQGQSLTGRISEVVQEEVWVWVLTENLSADRGCWEDGWMDGWTQMLKLVVFTCCSEGL